MWFRYTRLRWLARQGVLAEWQRGTDFDDAVYRVAATITMSGLQLDQEAFVQRLRCETPALNSSLRRSESSKFLVFVGQAVSPRRVSH